jgi:HTH-type transcriptional regulator / antitoxin HipB
MHTKLGTSRPASEQIGREVRRARKRLGLRQDELALAANVSTRVVHQIEHGKPTSRLDSLIPTLDALGLCLEVREKRNRTGDDARL